MKDYYDNYNPFKAMSEKDKKLIEKLKNKDTKRIKKQEEQLEKFKKKNFKQSQKRIDKENKANQLTIKQRVEKYSTFLCWYWGITFVLGVLVVIGAIVDINILCTAYFQGPLYSLILIGFFVQLKYSALKQMQARSEIKDRGFNCDKEISIDKYSFMIDYKNKKWLLMTKANPGRIYDFSKILSYEIYEDGNSVVKGSTGKALLGGAFFGVTGAIIGSSGRRKTDNKCTSLKLLIKINELDNPLLALEVVKSETSKDSIIYKDYIKKLQEICGCIEFIINNKEIEIPQKETQQEQIKTKREQLLELKELLQEGLISEEDFNKKKEDILK